ncbi:hypothetical protein ACPA9J_02190 [Pseudomonas aeruginosa]
MARFESYRGFLFGSLNPDVRPLAEHLGESAKIIDMIVDQSPEGLEVLRALPAASTKATGSSPPRTAPTATTSAFGAPELRGDPEPAPATTTPRTRCGP